MLNYNDPFLLIASDHNIEELTQKLIRIGLDNIYGYFTDIDKWSNSGNELKTVRQITCNGLSAKLENDEVYVLDVRGSKEYNEGHIKGAIHIHTGALEKELDKIPVDKDVVVHCASGDRSSIAVSYLMRKDFNNVINLTGGYSSWINDCGKKYAENTVTEEVEV